MRMNHVPLVSGRQHAVSAFLNKDVEVIKPKVGHYLLQLPLTVGGAQELSLLQLLHELLLRPVTHLFEHL